MLPRGTVHFSAKFSVCVFYIRNNHL